MSHALNAIAIALACSLPAAAAASSPPDKSHEFISPFTISHISGAATILDFDQALLARPGPVRVESFPLAPNHTIDLELQPLANTLPHTRFVLGVIGGPDIPLDFDAASILHFRGQVPGHPNSHVFLSVAPGSTIARIDLGPGSPRYLLSSRSTPVAPLRDNQVAVFSAQAGGGTLGALPICGVAPAPVATPAGDGPVAPPPDFNPRALSTKGRQQIQLAVETDYEYFELFASAEDAATYIVQMYAALSDIYIRDVNTRVDLSFVRLWNNPADLYHNNSDPLSAFQGHWNSQMQHVQRDVAQFLAGSRFLRAGGVAYLSALCNENAYSWSGYTLGFFADPSRPDWMNRDIIIAAHELGHNCGTGHTHDYGLDQCQNASSPPRRGSIMAYCGQTFSGGDANHDLWFHEFTANRMRLYINSSPCIADDCNGNGVHDADDIATQISEDFNANGIPDECEDCNGNGVLDPVDIATEFSLDVNVNGTPDECEPDRNSNGTPDSFEIATGTSQDSNANRIPDECEADCDGDGNQDYAEIQANMPLDINRNLILDSCEDCDGDGVKDLQALDHAWNVYIASLGATTVVGEFHAVTGVLMKDIAPGSITNCQDLIITPDRRVLVASGTQHRVVAYDAGGASLGTLIPQGSGGLNFPSALLITPQSTLLVASRGSRTVVEYNLATGAFIRVLVTPGGSGLTEPSGLTFTPWGNLLVSAGDHRVLEFNASTGAFVRVFVAAGAGGLSSPRGLLFKPDGNLLVASLGSDAILEYNGTTGAFIKKWNRGGTNSVLTLDEPWCLRLGPDGDVYVSRSRFNSFDDHDHGGDGRDHPGTAHIGDVRLGGTAELHLTDARIYQFDIRNGNLVRSFLTGVDARVFRPTGFDFMPGQSTDCNRNASPDNCDISQGLSLDNNIDGIPDECQSFCTADINHDGYADGIDADTFNNAFDAGDPGADINHDGFVDGIDADTFNNAFDTGC